MKKIEIYKKLNFKEVWNINLSRNIISKLEDVYSYEEPKIDIVLLIEESYFAWNL